MVAIFDGLAPVPAAGVFLLVDPVSKRVEVVMAGSQFMEAYCCLSVVVLVPLRCADSYFYCDAFLLTAFQVLE